VLKLRIAVGLMTALAALVLPVTAAMAADNFVVSKAQYDRMFPDRKAFYSYGSLVKAMKRFPAFAHTGNLATRKREAAAFLANVSHETGGGKYINEQNKANWSTYCDPSLPYGCPAGQAAYHGRGPMQLSWNANYKAAGDALGVDLLHHPSKLAGNPALAWKTGLWFWMTQTGAGSMTGHHAMADGKGFGQTIHTINGAVECGGGNPAEVADRVAHYKKFTNVLGVSPGAKLSC
jgi:predicted chitinase